MGWGVMVFISTAMEIEGLFRVPGQSMIMSRLKDDFDAAGRIPRGVNVMNLQ
jgi:hypothetical protein